MKPRYTPKRSTYSMLYKDYEKNENVRVKYLDADDIKSFGYRQSGINKEIFLSKKVDDPVVGEYTYGISHGKLELVVFKRFEKKGFTQDIFRGKVKNKSELKRILEQTGAPML